MGLVKIEDIVFVIIQQRKMNLLKNLLFEIKMLGHDLIQIYTLLTQC